MFFGNFTTHKSVFTHSYQYRQDVPADTVRMDPFELKEINLLLEDSGPEGYIINELAIAEMQRIARAAHMKKNFTVLQPTFFSTSNEEHKFPVPSNILTCPNYFPTQLPQHDQIASLLSLQSTTSGSSYSTSVLASNASLDSGVSQGSLPGSYGYR